MTTLTYQVQRQALQLNPVERAGLIEDLLRSFDKAHDQEVDARLPEEAESRIDTYESGKLSADSAEAVFARIRQR